ncbi:MAG: hypothetical protein AAB407_01610 [Patescibacteria group bacterium]
MDWLKEHWFKVGILAIGVFIVWILYNAFVIQPQKAQEIEEAKIAAEEARIATELEMEEERKINFATCLEESEYERTTSHLALCGDPNVGEAPKTCSEVFGGTKNYAEVLISYAKVFPANKPDPSGKTFDEVLKEA